MYNETMAKIQELREDIKVKKEEKKEMFMKNHTLVAEITNLHTQQEEADKREKELTRDFSLLERQDIMINNEKKHKITEISKTTKQIEEYKQEKLLISEKCSQIEAENPEIEQRLRDQQAQKSEKETAFEKLDMEVR